MDKFIEKWQSDKKYRAKIKLILYGMFIAVVSIYAMSLSKNYSLSEELENNIPIDTTKESMENIITIPKNYNYKIKISIDDNEYQYYGIVVPNKKTITKIVNSKLTNYVYQNNEYYLEEDGVHIKTTKDEVFDIINYNYLNLETINEYLNKATKTDNQYLIYLKDIILENDTNEYFVILINDNNISIDYTPLMKQFNDSIKNCQVDIEIEKIE